MLRNPPLELSRLFSYDALASLLVLDQRQFASDDPEADPAELARLRLQTLLTTAGRPVTSFEPALPPC